MPSQPHRVRIGRQLPGTHARDISWGHVHPAAAEGSIYDKLPAFRGQRHTVHLRSDEVHLEVTIAANGDAVQWHITAPGEAAEKVRILLAGMEVNFSSIPHGDETIFTASTGRSVQARLPERFVTYLLKLLA